MDTPVARTIAPLGTGLFRKTRGPQVASSLSDLARLGLFSEQTCFFLRLPTCSGKRHKKTKHFCIKYTSLWCQRRGVVGLRWLFGWFLGPAVLCLLSMPLWLRNSATFIGTTRPIPSSSLSLLDKAGLRKRSSATSVRRPPWE